METRVLGGRIRIIINIPRIWRNPRVIEQINERHSQGCAAQFPRSVRVQFETTEWRERGGTKIQNSVKCGGLTVPRRNRLQFSCQIGKPRKMNFAWLLQRISWYVCGPVHNLSGVNPSAITVNNVFSTLEITGTISTIYWPLVFKNAYSKSSCYNIYYIV